MQEGCDKFCAFCVVPYTRGAEVSRPAARIEAEARELVERGVVEITLLGQNVNAYRDARRRRRSPRSSARLAAIEGLARIRYTTSHPNDMDDDLIAAHAEEAKLMPFLHLPVQSGSDRVLKAMNRRHRAEDYLRLVERIRAARPDMALSGDFIVGFPGETEADFAETLALVEAVGYAQAYSFAYSPRPGTPAAGREPGSTAPRAPSASSACRRSSRASRRPSRRPSSAATLPVLVEKPGRLAGQMVGPLALPERRPPRGAGRCRRHHRHRPHRHRGDELPRGRARRHRGTSQNRPDPRINGYEDAVNALTGQLRDINA